MNKRLTVEERQAIFQALVETQDVIADVPRSRQMIAKKFGITDAALRQIEEEGIDRQWPPLDEEPAHAGTPE
jgi:transposase-like protein